MVLTNKVSAVLCSTDLDRSREFYEGKVGLRQMKASITS